MIPYVRQEKILEILESDDVVTIDDLKKSIPNVSVSTLRRDLKELERAKSVQMLSGGAVKLCSSVSELPISTKSILHIEDKKYIANLAMREINEGETIYLDSGSTCTALLKQILDKKIHIITTNTDVFSITGKIEAEITMLGGNFSPNISSLSGPLTLENLRNYIFDKAFIGANGIDLNYGVTTPNLVEATKKKEVCNQSKKTYLLCDSSKFHKTSTVKAFDLHDVVLITVRLDEELEKELSIISE